MEDMQNTQFIPGSNDAHQRGVFRVEALTVVLIGAMTFPWIAAPRISAAVLLPMGGISQILIKRSKKEEMPKMPKMPEVPSRNAVSYSGFYKEIVEKNVAFCARHQLGDWGPGGKYYRNGFLPQVQFFKDGEWPDCEDNIVEYATEANPQEQEEQIGQNPFANWFSEETK
ncbi:MAG: hypothetical protein JSR80_04120 [Verrucomicrobia bacterium]|nr:hypothetical protein [Verrucomicrobiota bacterium]